MGMIEAGGEVTDYLAGQHNAMGVTNFEQLEYSLGGSYIPWNGWTDIVKDYNYQLAGLAPDSFQDYGYNP